MDAYVRWLGSWVRERLSDEQLGRLMLSCFDATLLDEVAAILEPDPDERARLLELVAGRA